MTELKLSDHVKFAGGGGEITKIKKRPSGEHLLQVYTTEGQLRKLLSALPHIERIASTVDRLAAKQIDAPLYLFDEAHHLTARYGGDDSVERTQRYMAGKTVAGNSDTLGTSHKEDPDKFDFLVNLPDLHWKRDEQGKDMFSVGGNTNRQLKSLRHEWDGRLVQLDEKKHIRRTRVGDSLVFEAPLDSQ